MCHCPGQIYLSNPNTTEPCNQNKMNVFGYLLNILFKNYGSGGIRTHASEETGALNQRLRPLGHATH